MDGGVNTADARGLPIHAASSSPIHQKLPVKSLLCLATPDVASLVTSNAASFREAVMLFPPPNPVQGVLPALTCSALSQSGV